MVLSFSLKNFRSIRHEARLLCVADSRVQEFQEHTRNLLGHYNKTLLQEADFPLASVPKACETAEAHDATVAGGDKPEVNTTRVYKLWQSIVKKAALAQLPECLRSLALKVRGLKD